MMREYRLDNAEDAIRDWLEARRRREQPAGMVGRLDTWTPDADDHDREGVYEDLLGLTRWIPASDHHVLELYYCGSLGPAMTQRRLQGTGAEVVIDEWRAVSPRAKDVAEYLTRTTGLPWTEDDILEVRRKAVDTVRTALLRRITAGE